MQVMTKCIMQSLHAKAYRSVSVDDKIEMGSITRRPLLLNEIKTQVKLSRFCVELQRITMVLLRQIYPPIINKNIFFRMSGGEWSRITSIQDEAYRITGTFQADFLAMYSTNQIGWSKCATHARPRRFIVVRRKTQDRVTLNLFLIEIRTWMSYHYCFMWNVINHPYLTSAVFQLDLRWSWSKWSVI